MKSSSPFVEAVIGPGACLRPSDLSRSNRRWWHEPVRGHGQSVSRPCGPIKRKTDLERTRRVSGSRIGSTRLRLADGDHDDVGSSLKQHYEEKSDVFFERCGAS